LPSDGQVNILQCYRRRDATFDVITSDLMYSEKFFMFDVYATNLMLKTIFVF